MKFLITSIKVSYICEHLICMFAFIIHVLVKYIFKIIYSCSCKRFKNDLSYNSMSTYYKSVTGVVRFLRDSPPAHYSIKIESFSVLANLETEKYESSAFEASGFTWYAFLNYSPFETVHWYTSSRVQDVS